MAIGAQVRKAALSSCTPPGAVVHGFSLLLCHSHVFFFKAEAGIRDYRVTGVQTCALPISIRLRRRHRRRRQLSAGRGAATRRVDTERLVWPSFSKASNTRDTWRENDSPGLKPDRGVAPILTDLASGVLCH